MNIKTLVKIAVLILVLISAGKAFAQVQVISDLPGTMTIDGGGTIGGAQYDCISIAPTTPDGDVVTGNNQNWEDIRGAFTVTDAYAYVSTSGTTSAITVDINEAGSTILSTKLTIDFGENDSTTAATPAVISDTALAANAVISVDTDAADSGNTGAGLRVKVCGYYN